MTENKVEQRKTVPYECELVFRRERGLSPFPVQLIGWVGYFEVVVGRGTKQSKQPERKQSVRFTITASSVVFNLSLRGTKQSKLFAR